MFNSFNSADRFDESQNSQSESINLDEEVSLLNEKANQHTQEMSAMTQDANVDKESEMDLLMKQLNGEPEDIEDTPESRVVDVDRLGDTTPYSSESILSELSESSQNNWYTDMKHIDTLTDSSGTILSLETQGKNTQNEAVGSCFYRDCDCAEFSSNESCTINEYYDANGNVDRADAPVEYNQAA